MKNQEMIVLGLAGIAVYMIVKAGGFKTSANAGLTYVPGLLYSGTNPAVWTSAQVGNDLANNYAAYGYGRNGL